MSHIVRNSLLEMNENINSYDMLVIMIMIMNNQWLIIITKYLYIYKLVIHTYSFKIFK